MPFTAEVVSSGEVYTIQHYVIKFVSELRQVGGFPRVLRFPPTNKTDRHDIDEIVLKVALNTIILTLIASAIWYANDSCQWSIKSHRRCNG